MKAKILFFDIETSYRIGAFWDRPWEARIIKLLQDTEILSIAWKWQGQKTVHCLTRASMSEKALCREFAEVLEKADLVIAHNGDQFDIKKTNTRFIKHNIQPTKALLTVDTKKEATKYFSFNSNSLQDLGEFLGCGSKLKHEGLPLWTKCMEGCKKAFKRMARYNKQDVVLLERVYKKLRPRMVKNGALKKIAKMEDL